MNKGAQPLITIYTCVYKRIEGNAIKLGVRGFEATAPKIRKKKKEEYRRKRGEVFGDI